MSEEIFNFTEGQIQLGEVTIQLPPSWQGADNCSPSEASSRPRGVEEADVIISHSPSLLGDTPYTLQYGGCKQQGKNIQLPLTFLKSEITSQEKSRIQAKEWFKLRFGVFEEDGSAVYPRILKDGINKTHVNGCKNTEQVFLSVVPLKEYFFTYVILSGILQ